MSTFDPARILQVLLDHDVAFVVIGAGAAWLQGNPVATIDIDVMPQQNIDNAEQLADALNTLGPRINGRAVMLEERDFLGWQPLHVDTDAGPVDVVPTATAIGDYEDVVRTAVTLHLGNAAFLVADIEDVIRSKRALGRPKDVAALPSLEATARWLRGRPGGALPPT